MTRGFSLDVRQLSFRCADWQVCFKNFLNAPQGYVGFPRAPCVSPGIRFLPCQRGISSTHNNLQGPLGTARYLIIPRSRTHLGLEFGLTIGHQELKITARLLGNKQVLYRWATGRHGPRLRQRQCRREVWISTPCSHWIEQLQSFPSGGE